MIDVMWALIIGLVLVGAGYFGYAGKFKGIAMIIGVLLVVAALFLPGYGYWGDAFAAPEQTTTGTAAFDIEMSNGSWASATITGSAAADSKSVTYQLNVNSTANTYDQVYGSANFTLSPVAPAGATNDDLVTISWYMDDEITYSGNDVFDETSSVPDVDCWINGISAAAADKAVEGGSGQWTMLYTSSDWLTVSFELSSGSTDDLAAELDAVGDTFSVPITFSCGSWSETLNFDFVVITEDT